MACAPNKSRPVSLTFHLIRVPPPTHPSPKFALFPPFSPTVRNLVPPYQTSTLSSGWSNSRSIFYLSLLQFLWPGAFSLILIRKFLLGGGLALVTNPGPQPSAFQLPHSCSISVPPFLHLFSAGLGWKDGQTDTQMGLPCPPAPSILRKASSPVCTCRDKPQLELQPFSPFPPSPASHHAPLGLLPCPERWEGALSLSLPRCQ